MAHINATTRPITKQEIKAMFLYLREEIGEDELRAICAMERGQADYFAGESGQRIWEVYKAGAFEEFARVLLWKVQALGRGEG